jgi:hypothetical protein
MPSASQNAATSSPHWSSVQPAGSPPLAAPSPALIEIDHLRQRRETVEEGPQRLMVAARPAMQADQHRLLAQGVADDLQLRIEHVEKQTHAIDGDEHERLLGLG